MEVLLLMLTLNASTGEPVSVTEVKHFASQDECEAYRTSQLPQFAHDGLATVYACAVPPKKS